MVFRLGRGRYYEKSMKRDFSEVSLREGKYILELLERGIGSPSDDLKRYEAKSVFTFSTNNISNVDQLQNTKIRMYTEPNTLWWKENRMMDYEELNAFYINELYSSLSDQDFKAVEQIQTQNKGYKANGERHPHSWSIVDKENLVNWMLEN